MLHDGPQSGLASNNEGALASAAQLASATVPAVAPRQFAIEGYRPLPSFFIIGPPRTGTSWLHEVLSGHLALPEPTKETRFFDDHFHRGLGWYLRHFPKSNCARETGEIAPTYFASVLARVRIQKTVPQARIVCIFRNPLQRVLSLYRVKRAYGLIPWSFDQAIVNDPELLASGMYATNLKAWQSAFGRERVLATIYDDLREQPQLYLDSLLDFLGVPRLALSPSQICCVHSSESMTQPRNYYWTRGTMAVASWLKAWRFDRVVASVKKSPLRGLVLGGGTAFGDVSAELAGKICELFRPEIDELEALLNRDFSSWKTLEA